MELRRLVISGFVAGVNIGVAVIHGVVIVLVIVHKLTVIANLVGDDVTVTVAVLSFHNLVYFAHGLRQSPVYVPRQSQKNMYMLLWINLTSIV